MYILNVAVWIVTVVIGAFLVFSGWLADLPNEISGTARVAAIFYVIGVALGNWQVMLFKVLRR